MDSRRVLLSYNRGWGANKVRDISKHEYGSLYIERNRTFSNYT